MEESDPEFRYFVFAVLHEVAHVDLDHKSQMFDGITSEKNTDQEIEANAQALKWYNMYVTEQENPDLPKLKIEEIKRVREKNQAERIERYEPQQEEIV